MEKNNNAQSKTLILIDGHALAFRSFFALERTGMKTSDKEPTWAVFGFFKAIFDLLKNQTISPDCIAVTFDVSHHTFRTECYEEYKANREQMPDTMKSQMALIMEGLNAFNIPIYTKEGFEADDVIGTIVTKASKLGHKTVILTGDQDAFQLIDREGLVHVLIPSKGELVNYGWNEVYNKLGIYPDQVIDYKALRGDTSDNIPGIRGIGEKTAVKLLDRFQTLDNVLSHIEDVDGKSLKEKLTNGVEAAKMSYFLATIKRDVDIEFDFEKTKLDMPDVDKVSEFLKRVQFFSFLKNLPDILRPFSVCSLASRPENIDSAELKKQQLMDQKLIDFISLKDGTRVEKIKEEPESKPKQPAQQHLGLFATEASTDEAANSELVNERKTIVTQEDFEKLLEELNKQTLIAIDTETTSVNALEADLVGISLAYNEEIQAKDSKVLQAENKGKTKSFYIPVFHKFGEQLEMDYVLENLKSVFENPAIFKTFQNAKYEINTLLKYNIGFKGIIFDTMLASYINDPSRKHGLKVQSAENLNYFMTEIEELIGKGKKQITMDDVAIEDASDYACDDAFVTLELTRYWNEKLDEQSKKLLYDIEVPTSLVLAKMEEQGVSLDTEYLAELAKELDTNLKEMEEQIFALAGESFNINSPKQVATVLFEKMGIEHKKKRGAQKFSTDAKVLEELAKEHEIARCLLKYRHYSKMKSTYVDALPDLISHVDGKIHTNYNQTITVTGRLSSSNPNLQNIPVRTKLGSRIRKAFVPEDKNAQVLLSADYSQIELRLLAHCSGDENLIHAFKTGEDIHAQTAAKVFDVPLSEVTKEMRARAKAVNFGIIYGQTRWGLASALGISNEEAQMFIDKYFLTYPKVKEYMENSIQEAYRHGYAQTMYGRKRYLLDELMSSNRNIKEFAQRAAINTPLQGAASDLIKLAMIDLDKKLEQNNLKSKMIMQVHDELILETCKDELETVQKLVKEAMELNQPLKVPLVVDMEYGSSWMEDEE
ncbi:MAG: DNA polymerase I [Clostridium sp.]|nr:DNA polymerase I [Clostridium sp.]